MKRYTIISIRTYEVDADSYDEAIEKAMDDDYVNMSEDFPDTEGY